MDAGTFLSVFVPVVIGAAFAACAVIYCLVRLERTRTNPGAPGDSNQIARFLFAEDELIDTNGIAKALFDGHSWQDFVARFRGRFPALEGAPVTAPAQFLAASGDDNAVLRLRPETRWLCVELSDPGQAVLAGQAAFDARLDMAAQTSALDASPYPIWTSDQQGQVLWANEAYRKLAERVRPPDPSDATNGRAGLFDLTLSDDKDKSRNRLALSPGRGEPVLWYDIHSERRDSNWLHYAVDINAVVNSEIAQRNFVQTLTKTFAHLSIGLAIFDRNRQLALFNPALIDLTALPADFLSLRPDLFSFFDRLRDRRMMPEPKNYSDWREQLTALVTEASHGQYSDTWTLPSGLTYRISGRPHPDGAVAFLFEDISAEISLTRRFRSELELGQNVIDTFNEAVVVFSALGVLSLTNEKYDLMWPEIDPNHLNEINILNSSRVWQNGCLPTKVWSDVREFVTQRGERATWSATAERLDGTAISVRCVPLPGGATLIGFNKGDVPAPQPDNSRDNDLSVEA